MQENSRLNIDAQNYLSRRTKFLLLGLLLILNTVIRIPSIPHEKGYDSFFIHILANSISMFGSAKWWINWLSVFGYYPDSYPSAVPFTISGISQVMGIEMEKAILLFCIVMGLFGICTTYVVAERFYNHFISKYIMSFFFSLAPGFMLFTTWEVSTRGQFIVFLPFYLYILLEEDFKLRKYFLLIVCIIFVFSTHHYSFFLVPISIIYLVLKIIYKVKPKLFTKQHLNYILLLFFIASLMYPFFTGMFITSGSRYWWVQNAMTTNIRQIGPLMLFFPGGLAFFFLTKKGFEGMFMCLTIILLAPIFYSQIYGPFILLFISVFLISFAFNNLLIVSALNKNKLTIFSVIGVIFLFVAFSSFYNHNRTGNSDSGWYMEENTYSCGIWAKNNIPENTHGLDSGFETSRVFAVSEGHPITISQDIANLAYGWFKESDIVSVDNSFLSSGYYFDGPSSVKYGTGFVGKIEWMKYTANKIQNLKGYDYFIQDRKQHLPIDNVIERESDLIFDSPRISIWKIPN